MDEGRGNPNPFYNMCVCIQTLVCACTHVCAHVHTFTYMRDREAFFLSHFSKREVRSCGSGSGEREMMSEPVNSEYWMVWGKWQLNERQSCSKAVNIPAAWFAQGKTVVDRLTNPYNTSESKLTLIANGSQIPRSSEEEGLSCFLPLHFPLPLHPTSALAW